jgi:hypothetical protein
MGFFKHTAKQSSESPGMYCHVLNSMSTVDIELKTAVHPRRLWTSYLPPWEPEISHTAKSLSSMTGFLHQLNKYDLIYFVHLESVCYNILFCFCCYSDTACTCLCSVCWLFLCIYPLSPSASWVNSGESFCFAVYHVLSSILLPTLVLLAMQHIAVFHKNCAS